MKPESSSAVVASYYWRLSSLKCRSVSAEKYTEGTLNYFLQTKKEDKIYFKYFKLNLNYVTSSTRLSCSVHFTLWSDLPRINRTKFYAFPLKQEVIWIAHHTSVVVVVVVVSTLQAHLRIAIILDTSSVFIAVLCST